MGILPLGLIGLFGKTFGQIQSEITMMKLFALISAIALASPAYAGEYAGPIYDAHAHLPRSISADDIKVVYKKAGIEKAVIFVKPNLIKQSKKLEKVQKTLGPGFFIFPDVHGGRRGGYELKEGLLNKVSGLFKSGSIGGVGEVYIHLSYAPFAPAGIITNIASEAERTLLKRANALGMTVHIHHEAPDAALKDALSEFSNIKFVLAHSGYLAPSVLDKLMSDHPNLYADLSLISNHYFGPFKDSPKLKKSPSDEWKTLLIKHQSRFLVGSDIGASLERVSKLPSIIEDYRIMLGHLPNEVAEKIAYRNFEQVIGRH